MQINGYKRVRPIHILDIGNLIGNNVVVGGVRRTAEIFLMDADDYESIFAKYGINGLWDEAKHKAVIEKVKTVGLTMLRNGLKVWRCLIRMYDRYITAECRTTPSHLPSSHLANY
jgi:hypothetical protein